MVVAYRGKKKREKKWRLWKQGWWWRREGGGGGETVLRKADTRGGWEQCRSMPASQPASQPTDPTLPSLLLFSSLTLYPLFSTPTSADSPGDKTRTAPRATPAYPFLLQAPLSLPTPRSSCLSFSRCSFLFPISASFPSFRPLCSPGTFSRSSFLFLFRSFRRIYVNIRTEGTRYQHRWKIIAAAVVAKAKRRREKTKPREIGRIGVNALETELLCTSLCLPFDASNAVHFNELPSSRFVPTKRFFSGQRRPACIHAVLSAHDPLTWMILFEIEVEAFLPWDGRNGKCKSWFLLKVGALHLWDEVSEWIKLGTTDFSYYYFHVSTAKVTVSSSSCKNSIRILYEK